MCLSQTTGYAIQALACMESLERKPCFIRDVAQCTGVPKPYLAQIINRLSHKGIIAAKRGYRGGIAVIRPANAIPLLEIVEAVEGKEWIGPCLLGMQKCCSQFVCPTHEFWTGIQKQIEDKLRCTTLADVILNVGLSKAPMHTTTPSKPTGSSRKIRRHVMAGPVAGKANRSRIAA